MADNTTHDHLISLVQERPSLYDLSCTDYYNKKVQDKLWKEVSDILQQPMNDLRRKWRNMRGSFSKCIKDETSAVSGSRAKKRKVEWYLRDQMLFLLPYMKRNHMSRNFDTSDDTNEDIILEEQFPICDISILESTSARQPSAISLSASTSEHHQKKTKGKNVKPVDEVVNSKTTNSSMEDLLMDPDVAFYVGLLPDIRLLSDVQKRKFKLNMHANLNALLDDNGCPDVKQ